MASLNQIAKTTRLGMTEGPAAPTNLTPEQTARAATGMKSALGISGPSPVAAGQLSAVAGARRSLSTEPRTTIYNTLGQRINALESVKKTISDYYARYDARNRNLAREQTKALDEKAMMEQTRKTEQQRQQETTLAEQARQQSVLTQEATAEQAQRIQTAAEQKRQTQEALEKRLSETQALADETYARQRAALEDDLARRKAAQAAQIAAQNAAQTAAQAAATAQAKQNAAKLKKQQDDQQAIKAAKLKKDLEERAYIAAITQFNLEKGSPGARYLRDNPDVARVRIDPWTHYTLYGKKEGRKWPGAPGGAASYYLAAVLYLKLNPDVARAGMDPWRHYTRFGKNEGREWPGPEPL